MQNQHSSSYLVSNVQMLPSLVPEWWEPGGHGNILGLKEESESSPCESALLASASTDFQLCHFLEKHLLKKEMKLIKKISDFLTNLCPRPVRRTAWGSVSSKDTLVMRTRSLWPLALQSHLGFSDTSFSPSPASPAKATCQTNGSWGCFWD